MTISTPVQTATRTSAPPAAARRITITDPRDGTEIGSVPVADDEEVRAALAAARTALPAWRATPPAARGLALRDAAHALAAREHELAELNTRETGRPYDEALAGVRAGIDTFLQYSELGPVHRGRSLRGAPTAADYTRAEPRGVAVLVTPWNDPVAVAAGLLGAALVSGNTVVHKPSERCPHLGALLGQIIAPAFPAHVVQTVLGDAQTGQALVGSPGVDVVAHVGSTASGRRIAEAVARTGAHLVRENGGNDALVVDEDVDHVWAAEQAALGAFANTGQICTSVERVFVHRAIAEAFLEAMVAQARDRNERRLLGPLVDERMRTAVHDQVAASLRAGARALVGGEVPEGPGSYYPATVLVDCTPDMPVMTEETFGPVAPVVVVDSFEEGLALAAADRYGLAATVLTGSLAHAHAAVDTLPVGTVKVNAVFGGAPGGSAQPRGDSGSGFGYGPELLDEMTTVKVVHLEAARTA